MSRRDYAAGGKRDGAVGAGRRGDDPALGRRENNHLVKQAEDMKKAKERQGRLDAIKAAQKAKAIARERASGSRGNKKQPPGHARY